MCVVCVGLSSLFQHRDNLIKKTGNNTYMALRAHIQPVQLIPVLKRNRAAVPEKSYRNPEIDENLQVRLASYLGLSYRMFLIGTQAAKGGPRDEKMFNPPHS